MICSICQHDKPCPGVDAITHAPICRDCVLGGSASSSKFGNCRTPHNGRMYDSKAEAERAAELDLLLQAGEIHAWKPQPLYRLGCHENVYIADFAVYSRDKLVHVEDVKGVETPKFRRDKLLWKRYGETPLVLLKRSGNGWKKEIIWPVDVDRSSYKTDLLE